MMALVITYVGLIGLLGYGIYFHAVENVWIIRNDQVSTSIRLFLMIAYAAPFVVGPPMILSMLKPIFARRSQERTRLTLDRSQEPELYDVLERLCATIGAPMPRDIEVDCRLNAAAGFRAGVGSLFRRRMSLVIGLPLVEGLSLQQFIGVLAHELGHFSQGFGIRLAYLIRQIDNWLFRVVYEPDQWDEALGQLSKSICFRLGFLLSLARIGVWLNRRVLWVLMSIGRCISCAFTRRMEYDADRVATEIVGSKAYEATLCELEVLAMAERLAHGDLAASWREKRLPDNLPLLIAARADEFGSDDRRRIINRALAKRNGVISTHPSLSRRLAAIQRRMSQGVFRQDVPATSLFSNFKMIANAVTLTEYRCSLDLSVERNNLVSTDELLHQRVQTGKDVSASKRFFAGCHHLYLPPLARLDAIGAPADPRAAVTRLKSLRSQFDGLTKEYGPAFEGYADSQDRLSELHVADVLLRAGFKRIGRDAIAVADSTRRTVSHKRTEVLRRIDEFLPKLKLMNDLLGERLKIALELACVPEVAFRLRLDGNPSDEIERLLPVVCRFEMNVSSFPTIARNLEAAASLIRQAPSNGDLDDEYPMLMPLARRLVRETRTTLEGARYAFEGVAYPFGHAGESVSVADYLSTDVTAENDVVDVLRASNETLDKLIAIYARSLGRLVHIAERVERAVGLPMVDDSE